MRNPYITLAAAFAAILVLWMFLVGFRLDNAERRLHRVETRLGIDPLISGSTKILVEED